MLSETEVARLREWASWPTSWPESAVRALLDERDALRALVLKADSMLSLLRHRGGIRWSGIGMVTEYECDERIGELRAALAVRPEEARDA